MIYKLALIIILFTFFCSLILGYSNSQNKPKQISEVTDIKNNEVTKIVFSDGRGKNKPFTLEDKQKINEFIKLLDSYLLKKEKEHKESKGLIHMADFYNGDKKLIRITFTNPLEIDGTYYDILKGQLSTEKLDQFIKSSDPAWNWNIP
jgi:hypothetical protein